MRPSLVLPCPPALTSHDVTAHAAQRSPWYTLVLPLRTLPYTDGRAWARKPGHERHRGVRAGEELTDEEDEE